MKTLMVISTLMSATFTQMIHPLAMGIMLLSQTTIMCLISGLMHQSFWFQYILFMVFVGGMLVLFIYVASLASNEMFSLSTTMILLTMMSMPALMTIKDWTTTNSQDLTTLDSLMDNEITTMTEKMFNLPEGNLTILMALYLLMTLIVAVKITNVSKGPLRQTK
uniref:NADH-ubiquinone oxidoreductase chain 6 n=1 Tax=Bifiditermes nr. madagascariensis TaxID=2942751 RepID=A0A8X8M2P3_9NEOP|nr:NADH dehydrogenase subunit 6 [Bifiditermes nr. madagascariensis]